MTKPKTDKQRHWAKILKEAESSGMSLADYAKDNGLLRLFSQLCSFVQTGYFLLSPLSALAEKPIWLDSAQLLQ